MSWKSVISLLQDTSESLLSDNLKTVNSRNKISKIKSKVKSKNDNNDNDNQLSLDLLFKISKEITKSIENVEILLKEKDINFNSNSLTNDESIHDLISIKEQKAQLNNKFETANPNSSSTNNNYNITYTTNTPSTNSNSITITKSRGRGRPYGSTSSRSNGKSNSSNTASKFNKNSYSSKSTGSKSGKSSPSNSILNSTARSGIESTNNNNNNNKDNEKEKDKGEEKDNDNEKDKNRDKDKDNNNRNNNEDGGNVRDINSKDENDRNDKHINNAINSNIKNNTSTSDKLITIGAKYGYPAPPPLSTYNGKIGRSFYTSAYNPSTPILPNSQVAYCANMGKDGNNNFSTMHSEWILCRVLRVINETRFEIQDPEPDDLHPQGQIFRANYKEIILVPLHLVSSNISKLKEYKTGTRVLAKYPETTTFYPAEVMASKNGTCMLRFEGEEEVGKLTSVDRVFVLPCPK